MQKNPSFSPEEEIEIQVILEEMLHKQIIREMNLQNFSLQSLYLVKKPNGGTRSILNLKELNELVKYEHFKMDGIKTIINMVTGNCFTATIDLKDAYYSVAISRQFQKLLIFKWKDKLYGFTFFQMVLGLAQENSLN